MDVRRHLLLDLTCYHMSLKLLHLHCYISIECRQPPGGFPTEWQELGWSSWELQRLLGQAAPPVAVTETHLRS
jgi:hypothetical protein